MRPAPLLLRVIVWSWAALAAAFVFTGPWQYGATVLKQISIVAALGVLMFAFAAVSRDVRAWYGEVLREDVRLSRRTLLVALAVISVLLLRIVWSAWDALAVNAWDFSVHYDRPIERTLHGATLFNREMGASMLSVHPHWILFAFVPLYFVAATPLWLLAAHALGIAAGVAAAFAFFRSESRDDVVAAALALALLLNRYTAKALQYVFHPEVFYLPALFLMFYAFVRQKRALFAVALLFALSIKEDAIIPVAGFVLVALTYRRWRWAAVTTACAVAVFALDYFVVIPHFTPEAARTGTPWFARYWASFGSTPMEIAGGMLRNPPVVFGRVVTGSADMFLSTALVPLAGWPWLLAAVPALFVYGSADMDKLHWFTLYYSMPVLPAVFAALPGAIERISRNRRVTARVCALVVLLASIGVGTGHILHPPHPDRSRIAHLVQSAPGRIWLQGALFPHAGYEDRVEVLNERAVVNGKDAFLLAPKLNPYPYKRPYIEQLVATLAADVRYRRVDAGSLVLFVPVEDRQSCLSPPSNERAT